MAENNTPRNDSSNTGGSSRTSKIKKIETLQLRRLMKQEKENRELRKQMTTLLNYQRELEKRLKDSVDADEEIRKNNSSIDRILKENQKYERALQSAQEKLDEEQSDFYRIALQDNNIEIQRLKELNEELRKGNKNTEEQLEDMQDTMEDMNETFSDNLQSLIDSFNIMAIKDSMDEGIAEISQSMIDITNALHLSEDEADAFKKTLSSNLKEFNKMNNNMLNSADMQEAVAKLIEAGITDTNSILKFWESIAVADKLGYDIGSQQGIMQYVDSEADIENILGALVKTKGLDGVNQDGIIDAVNSFMPSISHLSDEQQARILNEAISTMATMQSQGIRGFEDLYADMIADAYSYDVSKTDSYLDKYGANARILGQQDIGAITQTLLNQVDMAGFNNAMLESYGWTEEMIDSANKTNANSEALLNKTEQLVKEDSMKALDTALEDFHTSVIDSLKNKISPYLMTISNEVSSWGLDWSDISGMFLAGKGIWDLVKGIANFFGISSLGAGAAGATATAAGATGAGGAVATGIGGKIASMGGALWGGIKGVGSTIAGAVGGTASAVALAVPAVLGYLGFKDAKAQQKAWEEKTPKEQEEELRKKVIQYMQEEEVIKDQSKSSSQFNAYGMHRGGLDNVPIDGYKAILHSGEAVLTRKEAEVYRANPEVLSDKKVSSISKKEMALSQLTSSISKKEMATATAKNTSYPKTTAMTFGNSLDDAKVVYSNAEALRRNDAFAQRSLSIAEQLKSSEVLGKARESAMDVFNKVKSTSTASADNSANNSSDTITASPGGPIDENLMYSSQTGFFQALAPGAKQSYQQYKVFPAVTLAQAALESGWGKSKVARTDKNLFGIKYNGKNAPGITITKGLNCPSNEPGGAVPYARYQSFADSMTDHGHFLHRYSRYSEALKANNPKDQIRLIHKAGYAGDPNYTKSIHNMMDKYNLTQYEQGTPYVPSDQVALLHKGEMVVPKEYNPINSGTTIPTGTDLTELMQLLKWGFEYIGKKLDEEKIVSQPTTNKNFRTLNERYQNAKIGR